MTYYDNSNLDRPEYYQEPNILKVIDNFLTRDEISKYQEFLMTNWTLGPSLENFKYLSRDLYHHYNWDGNWSNTRWRDDVPCEWENLYKKISVYLPPHRIHWVDVKITPPLSTGTPLHRDKDPWLCTETDKEFSKALSIICNLNSHWSEEWGGDLIAYQRLKQNNQTSYIKKQRIPIMPGQLIIAENFYHGINPVTKPECCRISFILHVLQYK